MTDQSKQKSMMPSPITGQGDKRSMPDSPVMTDQEPDFWTIAHEAVRISFVTETDIEVTIHEALQSIYSQGLSNGKAEGRKECEKLADDIVSEHEAKIPGRKAHQSNWGARSIGARDVKIAIRNLPTQGEKK